MHHCFHQLHWFACRYGLRHLAELNLVDLAASARHHGKNVPRIKWFAQLTGKQCALPNLNTLTSNALCMAWLPSVIPSLAFALGKVAGNEKIEHYYGGFSRLIFPKAFPKAELGVPLPCEA